MNWLYLIPAGISAITYRCGGSGNFPRWTRPVGVGFSLMAAMWMLGMWHWTVFPSAGLTAIVTTTYFKRPGQDASYINWMLCGLAFGLAMTPYAFATGHWLGFWLRTGVCIGLITAWSELIGWDVGEEAGRGFIIVATLPILII